MNMQPDDDLLKRTQSLCASEAGARRFFDAMSRRQNDGYVTTVANLAEKAELSYGEALDLAKKFDDIGLGTYTIGRRGSKTRIVWRYGLKQILRSLKLEAVTAEMEALDATQDVSLSPATATAQAKEFLARAYGVSPDAIQITVNL